MYGHYYPGDLSCVCLSLLPHPEEIEGCTCHEAESGVQSHRIHHRGLGVVLDPLFGEAMKMGGVST